MSLRILASLLILGFFVGAFAALRADELSDKLVGTWKTKEKFAGYDLRTTIGNDGGRWSINGTFEKDGTAAGTFVGERFRVAGGSLTFWFKFTKKPEGTWLDHDTTLRPDGDALVMSWVAKNGKEIVRACERVPGEPKTVAAAEKKEKTPDHPFAGTWKVVGASKFEETWTFEKTAKGWNIAGVFSEQGNEVGSCRGTDVRLTPTALSFTRLFDKKPAPEFKTGVSYAFTAKGDRGEFTIHTGKKATKQTLQRFDKTAVALAEKKTPETTPKPAPADTKKPDPGKPSVTETKPKADDPVKPDPAKPKEPFTQIAAFQSTKNLAGMTAALSPDGKFVAVASATKSEEVAVWDVATRKVVQKLPAGVGLARIVWSADGKTLAAVAIGGLLAKADQPKSLTVWDTATWEQKARFEDPKLGACLAVAGNGRYVAAAYDYYVTQPGNLQVFDIDAKKQITSVDHKAQLSQVAITNDGKTLVTNTIGGGDVALVDLPSGKTRQALKKAGTVLAVSSDASIVVSSAYGEGSFRLSIFDTRTPRTPRIIQGDKWRPNTMTLIDNNRHVVVGGTHDDIHIYNLSTGTLVHTFRPSKIRETLVVQATPDSAFLLTYGADRIARVWTTPYAMAMPPSK